MPVKHNWPGVRFSIFNPSPRPAYSTALSHQQQGLITALSLEQWKAFRSTVYSFLFPHYSTYPCNLLSPTNSLPLFTSLVSSFSLLSPTFEVKHWTKIRGTGKNLRQAAHRVFQTYSSIKKNIRGPKDPVFPHGRTERILNIYSANTSEPKHNKKERKMLQQKNLSLHDNEITIVFGLGIIGTKSLTACRINAFSSVSLWTSHNPMDK